MIVRTNNVVMRELNDNSGHNIVVIDRNYFN